MALQFQGVRVEPLGGPAQHVAQPFAALLDPAAAALEDPQPGRRSVRAKNAKCTPKPASSYVSGPAWASSSAKRSLPSAVIL